ncbi:MAG: transcription antitermination factor NusB [Alphaproteobacteria bacterium]|jgi:N utilization substance protein B|nr:transcription antitermination factor NusB [Beijerinckiaceae bacterium]NBQ39136.1 transcription antitermination factor NusB [Alphaproteobacteria bacterium]
MSRGELRSSARLGAVQALYQMEIAGKDLGDVIAEFQAHWLGQTVDDIEMKPAEAAFFTSLVEGVVRDQRAIDQSINASLVEGWPLTRIEAVLRAILRSGCFELLRRKDVPAKVVIREYGDIARAFYEGEEVGMVSAVLDRLAHQLRPGDF